MDVLTLITATALLLTAIMVGGTVCEKFGLPVFGLLLVAVWLAL